MPLFSIVIPAYNNAPLLARSLKSISSQTSEDWETIIVNDASTDDTPKTAHAAADADSRFRVVDKTTNGGLHLARKTGVEAATGRYLLFLDADDELASESVLESIRQALAFEPVDLLRLGVSVEPAGASEQACAAYESRANRAFPPMSGRESVRMSFEPQGGFEQDWRAWANVLARDLAQRAFAAMTDNRLERAEDALEFLAFASMANRQVTRTDIISTRYHFGSGISGPNPLTAEQFSHHVAQFGACIEAIDEYASNFPAFDLSKAAYGARLKLVEIMSNDWRNRVPDSDKPTAVKNMVDLFGPDAIASELMRLARDAAYEKIATGQPYDTADAWVDWLSQARQLMAGKERDASWRYRRLSAVAEHYAARLRPSERFAHFAAQPIRIFVSTHIHANQFESNILQPIQVGASSAEQRFPDCLHDDEGDNISDLNPFYCELTAQYWAWKNADAEYYGFCHYRRYFDFSNERHAENDWGEVMDSLIDRESQKRYALDDESIRRAIKGYDIVTTEDKELGAFPDNAPNPVSQWHLAEDLHDNDLIDAFAILRERHPEYAEDIEAFATGSTSRFCNMFIMRREIFHEYCSWLFPILEDFCASRDFSKYSREARRTPGHISERLLNVFLMHHERIGSGWKTKQVQCVHFANPTPSFTLAPPSEEEARHLPSIPVVLAADDSYVPMLTTTIHSMLLNASADYHYDIVVLTSNIEADNQRIMQDYLTHDHTATIRFVNVTPLIQRYELSTNNPHIGIETYYRFLIQDALPYCDKVVYLDSDLIVKGDVSELYAIDLGSNLIGAVRDVDYLGMLNMKDGKRYEYSKSVLGMNDPYDYFQAGVLVLNARALREEVPTRVWLEMAQDDRYIYNDQDILNVRCEGRVTFLDPSWNVMHNGWNRIGNVCRHAPADVFDAYLRARGHEKIIHYAGSHKPWNKLGCDRASEYWLYARNTPFYELLATQFTYSCIDHYDQIEREANDYPLVSDENIIRKIVDPILPPGSERREAVRSLVKKATGKP